MQIAVCIENIFNLRHSFLDRLSFEWETKWCQRFSDDQNTNHTIGKLD